MPLNVSVVLDRNGPVLQECLPGIKQALRDLVGQLSSQDRFSLVSIGGQVVIPAQAVDDAQAVARLIDHFSAGEEARTCEGLAEGLRQVMTGQAEGVVSRLIYIVSGETEEAQVSLLEVADRACQQGIPILAVGVGSSWNESFLFNLTSQSCSIPRGSVNGQVYYIPTPDDISSATRELFDALQVVTRQVQVRFLIARSIEVKHVWQVTPVITNIDQQTNLRSPVVISAQDLEKVGRAYLVELQFPPRAPGVTRVAQIEMTCQPRGQAAQKMVADLVVQFTPDSGGTNPLDTHVMDMLEAAQAHELCVSALADLDGARRQEAARKLRQAAAILASQGNTQLADRMRGEADYNIHRYGQVSNEGRKLLLLASQRGHNRSGKLDS